MLCSGLLTWLVFSVGRCLLVGGVKVSEKLVVKIGCRWMTVEVVVMVLLLRLVLRVMRVMAIGRGRVACQSVIIVVVHNVHPFVLIVGGHFLLVVVAAPVQFSVRRRTGLVLLKGVQPLELLLVTVQQISATASVMVSMVAVVRWQSCTRGAAAQTH